MTEENQNINTNLGCCSKYDNTILTHGDGVERSAVAGVSVQFFEDGGTLCFDNLKLDGLSNSFGVTINLDTGTIYGKIKATGQFLNNEVVYVSPSGNMYTGTLESNDAFDNELNDIGLCSDFVDDEPGIIDDITDGIFPIANFKNAFSIVYDSNINELSFIEEFTLKTIYKTEVIIPRERWTHIAIVRKDGKLLFYLNGNQRGETLPNDINYSKPTEVHIGRKYNVESDDYSYFLGEIDSLKVINNFCKYHCNFIPDEIDTCVFEETPTPTATKTSTPTRTPTRTPTSTPIPEKELRVYVNIKNLSSSVKIEEDETYVDEFTTFTLLPGKEISFHHLPHEGYKFLRIHGDTDWLDGYVGKMPDRDVDVYFEYSSIEVDDFRLNCEEKCPCDEIETLLVLPAHDPRVDLDFYEHITDDVDFRRDVEFEDNLPDSPGIKCEYEVYLFEGELSIKNKKTKSNFAWRDLILLRGNHYDFKFDTTSSIFKIYDTDGTELDASHGVYQTENWVYPLVVLPNDKTPTFLKYKLINSKQSYEGNVVVRSANHVSGVNTMYSHQYGSKTVFEISEDKSEETTSFRNGTYHTGMSEYVDLNEVSILSNNGLELELETTIECPLENVPGYLDTNSLTTLFKSVLHKTHNYRESRILINKFLNFDENFNALDIDFLTKFMWTSDVSYESLCKILFFTFLLEYANVKGKREKFLEVICSQLIDTNIPFKFSNDYYVSEILNKSELDESVSNVFCLCFVKTLNVKHRTNEQMVIDLYAHIKILRNSLIDEDSFSVYVFNSEYKQNLLDAKNIREPIKLPEKILMMTTECTDTELGEYVIRKCDDILAKSVFGHTDVTLENLKKLNNMTLRITANSKSYCYTVQPHSYNLFGIFDEVDVYRIFGNFDNVQDCCDIVRINEGVYRTDQTELTKTEIMPFKLTEAGSSRVMLSETVTNESHPIEKIGNNQYRTYIDSNVASGNVVYSSPGYFTVERDTSVNLMYRSVDVGYNSNQGVRDVISYDLDSIDINILTTWMTKDGTLNVVTDIDANLNIGDYISIEGGTRNSAINGTFRVKGVNENNFSLEFRTPMNMQINDMQNMNGTFKTSFATRIYTNVTGLKVGDDLVFDYASGGGELYEILKISQDSFGVCAIVKGTLNKKPNVVVKSHFDVSTENFVRFTYETKVSYYNVSNTNPQTHSLWMTHLPDITPDGRFNDTVSFIQTYNESLNS